MGEYHICQQIKALKQSILIKLDGNDNKRYIKLHLTSYDLKNKVIEFRPAENEDYNSALEKLYELPSWNSTENTLKQPGNSDTTRYLGDTGLILSLSYLRPKQQHATLLQQSSITHTSYYSTSNSSMLTAPKLQIKWLRVTLDWVLNGNQQQIYENSFVKLNELLAKEGCFKYNPLSEPILKYIVAEQKRNKDEQYSATLPRSLINYCHSHTHECHTRLSRLQHMLEGAGVDSQVIWKYSFAKSFVVGNGSLLCEEDVIRRIQDSEEEWRHKKPVLLRKLLLCSVA
ncbi:hypothetical protein BDF20DRAFT_814460 [Mycotypha africana]|uniref:uncharacterized protein n=1 Tax=Mycotypha africana TaxID=64632 RepID=UPI0023010079|nr:uncharacterized protein BDF20DRAFT_814460 [Mycotypha africana]KAI8988179.1 hypothetical protein BDF20DRAFT_814460 [Mycotypha africana]